MPCLSVSCSCLDGGRQEHPPPHIYSGSFVGRGSRCTLLGQIEERSGHASSFHPAVFLAQADGNAGEEPFVVARSRLGRGQCRGEGGSMPLAGTGLPGFAGGRQRGAG